ncbi:MAG: molybdopterin molybdotransferase MoeA [Deltaproteobacteria bacterium]|nr:molybdopterin molybdotransferase MoeA [Deltaproteobacteria bacterium]
MRLVPFEEALAHVLRGAERLGVEEVALEDADRRVLAEDLEALRPMPEHDQSAMDGYALRLADLEGDGPFALAVEGESRAGGRPPALPVGHACRIFTGATVPDGADVVVMQERVRFESERLVLVARPAPRQNIRARGEDLAEGAVVLRAGTRLRPSTLGLAAALDRPRVRVARRPRIALLGTGDELRAPGTAHRPGSLPESNAYVVGALARRAGAAVRVCPFAVDEPAALEQAMAGALEDADVLVTIGGASVGDHDLVRPTLERLGVVFDFAGVSMRPGKPTASGRLGGQRVLCLPGNPASATLAFHLLGVPLVRALQGDDAPHPSTATLPVLGTHRRHLGANCDGRDDFLRARLELRGGVTHARLAPKQSSGAVTSFAEADVLVRLSGLRDRIDEGDILPTLRLSELEG